MRLVLPDMSGPPIWWDIGVLLVAAAGAAGIVRHWHHTHTRL